MVTPLILHNPDHSLVGLRWGGGGVVRVWRVFLWGGVWVSQEFSWRLEPFHDNKGMTGFCTMKITQLCGFGRVVECRI